MSGFIWLVLAASLLATTKYLTSVRLRNLNERMQRDYQDANSLKHVLVQTSGEEEQLQAEIDALQAKVRALRNVVGNLQHFLQKHSGRQTDQDALTAPR